MKFFGEFQKVPNIIQHHGISWCWHTFAGNCGNLSKISCIKKTVKHHYGHGEPLLHLCGRSYVPKPYGCKACRGKLERGHIQRFLVGSSFPYPRAGILTIWSPNAQGHLVQDGAGDFIDDLVVSNAIPYASQPASGQQVQTTHQEYKDYCSIFQVVVQFPSYMAF